MKEIVQKIKLNPFDDLLESTDPNTNKPNEVIQGIDINSLFPFQSHPFRLYTDEKMQEMVDSIRDNGVLLPILIRPRNNGDGYEIISGHNRVEAAKRAGLSEVPDYFATSVPPVSPNGAGCSRQSYREYRFGYRPGWQGGIQFCGEPQFCLA